MLLLQELVAEDVSIFHLLARDRRGGCFGCSSFFAVKWATGDIPEECRFLLNTQLMFLKREKRPYHKKISSKNEWIRSLTEA